MASLCFGKLGSKHVFARVVQSLEVSPRSSPRLSAGFLPASLKQSPCIMVPFRMDAQSFHSSRRCLEEVQKKAQPGEQPYRHVEYIPTRRFKTSPNPVAIAWVIGLPSAFALFFLAKRQVEKKRVKQMKARRQMMAANKEDNLTQRTEKHLDTKTS